jgi:chemotaxis protein methyltransferase CheR
LSVELSQENFSKLSEFIYRKSGIALNDSHYEKLVKKFQARCVANSVDTFRKYFFLLRFEDSTGEEFQELINTLTVNETYFFRENHQFEVLTQYIMPQLHQLKPAGEPIRILNAPCSTGEESYTTAIHLLEADDVINERDIEIVGIDIDSKVIDKAQRGLFSDRSIHAIPRPLQNKYFSPKMGYNEIMEDLRGAIDFRVANVFSKDEMRELGKFDMIFSRNMLIYFDDASRKEVAMTFYNMLKPNGYVMLGHAEYMNRIVSVFNPVKYDGVMTYQK